MAISKIKAEFPFVGGYLKKQQTKFIQDLRNALEEKEWLVIKIIFLGKLSKPPLNHSIQSQEYSVRALL